MVSVKASCEFCRRNRNDILYGEFHDRKEVKCHYYCLLFAHILDQNGTDDEGILGFLLPDIRLAIERGKKTHCSYCGQPGALAKCFNSKCKKIFHLPCGLENGSLHLFFGDFRSFCRDHRLRQRVPPDVLNDKDVLCSICLDAVEDLKSINSLWAPCCKKNGWFHRMCIQKFAMSAAYFFKCPLCANQKKFREAMLKNGIYIPDQDASWELEPNAYADLLERYNKCDAAVCKCREGRDFSSNSSRMWTILLCQNCGSKGIHVGCIPGPRSTVHNRSMWDCIECVNVMKNSRCNDSHMLSLRENSEDDEDDVIIVDDEDESNINPVDTKQMFYEASSSNQDIKTVLSSAIHLTSSTSAEVIDLVDDDDDDDLMDLSGEDDDEAPPDENVMVKSNNLLQVTVAGNSLSDSYSAMENLTHSPVLPSSSSWHRESSWQPMSHEDPQPSRQSLGPLVGGETYGPHQLAPDVVPISEVGSFKIVNPEEILKAHTQHTPLPKAAGISIVPVITID